MNPARHFWQKHNQSEVDVVSYTDLLKFINLRAQATKTLISDPGQQRRVYTWVNFIVEIVKHTSQASFTVGANGNCVICKADKHPLYFWPTFKAMPRERMVSALRANNLCLNCLKPGHFARQCTSAHKCKKCQRTHHTLIHDDSKESQASPSLPTITAPTEPIVSNASAGSNLPSTLLMTCQVGIKAPDGTLIKARALLDS